MNEQAETMEQPVESVKRNDDQLRRLIPRLARVQRSHRRRGQAAAAVRGPQV